MGNGTRLEMYGGRLVVVKQAAAGPAAARLRHEAMCLRRITHPGVVELVDVVSADDVTVRTSFVGGGTLAERPPGGLGPDRTVQVVASVAATLAHLHGQGMTHGRVSADHVLAAKGGGAVLCGLAEAAVGNGAEAQRSAAAADVAALGALIRALAGDARAPEAPGLMAVAARALAEDPSARPSMRTLAEALGELAGNPGPGVGPALAAEGQGRRLLPRKDPPRRSFPWSRPGRRRLYVTGGLAGVVVALTAVVALGARTGPPTALPLGTGAGGDVGSVPAEPDPTEPDPTTTVPGPPMTVPTLPTTVPTPPTTDGIVRVWPPSSSCDVPPAGMAADIDGDGCQEGITVDNGVLGAGDHRWELAGPGDVVVVGDWDCDHIATPAVVRPGSGKVWRFPRWAGEGEVVEASLVATVPGAVGASIGRASELPPGCEHLAVLDATGVTTRIIP